ncbi:MAG TPA: class II glutamine amidotransferase [Phycisphaerae bacterium]|mgnify:CR=1 FL=1|nr:class II glutamine amidotransferase [Phycisphaerae bacterium]
MCRFVVYLGPSLPLSALLTEPSNSLINQSYDDQDREEPLNGDGFGVAWYRPEVGPEPALFRSISPAWSNRNLRQLARVTQSGCILAHIRSATQGLLVAESNCHPFVHGRLAFMHNGDLAGFSGLRRRLLAELSDEAFAAIEGSTDSEHIFAVCLDMLLQARAADPAEALAEALRAALRRVLALAAGVRDPHYLNLAVSDGRAAVVSRVSTDPSGHAASLFYNAGQRYTCANGVCRMIRRPHEPGAVIVSSERLSDDPGWEAVPVNHLVIVGADLSVRVTPADVGAC